MIAGAMKKKPITGLQITPNRHSTPSATSGMETAEIANPTTAISFFSCGSSIFNPPDLINILILSYTMPCGSSMKNP